MQFIRFVVIAAAFLIAATSISHAKTFKIKTMQDCARAFEYFVSGKGPVTLEFSGPAVSQISAGLTNASFNVTGGKFRRIPKHLNSVIGASLTFAIGSQCSIQHFYHKSVMWNYKGVFGFYARQVDLTKFQFRIK
ncbi:MAG: hypothetical protein AAF626_05860 [Pseudomonadota bacterium]